MCRVHLPAPPKATLSFIIAGARASYIQLRAAAGNGSQVARLDVLTLLRSSYMQSSGSNPIINNARATPLGPYVRNQN
jgi:hypothetical protein